MLGQLDGLQVVKEKGDFPLLAVVRYDFAAGIRFPLVSGRKGGQQLTLDGEIVKVCGENGRVGQSVGKLKPTR